MKLPFKKIDAFATNGSSGNPAGAIYLDEKNQIDKTTMLTLAKELKGFVSEVGYLYQLDKNRFWIRYYSSEREVAFCGHATVGIMYDLIRSHPALQAYESVTIETKNDTLTVYNRLLHEDAVYITAPAPQVRASAPHANDVARALGCEMAVIDSRYDIAVVNGGLETLIVPIKNLEEVLAITPNLASLNLFCQTISVDIVILFSGDVYDAKNSYRTRVFAATFGYLEDPATGSGNSAFGYYLLARKLWDGTPMRIEQSANKEHYNLIRLTTKEDRVLFGGGAIVKIEGEYNIFAAQRSMYDSQ